MPLSDSIPPMDVAVIGTGYVGLVTGACLTAVGHRVTCVDSNPARVAAVNGGGCPIHEEGLADLLRDGVAAGRLSASGDLAAPVARAQVIMVAVGTPSREGGIDLSHVEAACRQVGQAIKGRTDFPVVAIKSTVIPGTTDTLVRRILEQESGGRVGQSFGLAMNPEFLSQGSAVRDFVEADRIIIGQWDTRSGEALEALYRPFTAPVLRMGLRDAEMAKYAANFLQATLISTANQIAMLCEALPGADHRQVMEAVHLDRMLDGPDGGRAGATRFLWGGIGFGGSCFPKDLAALAGFGRDWGVPVPLVDAVLTINAIRPAQALNMLTQAAGGALDKRFAVLGLAFKPGTDDLRQSPSVKMMRRLAVRGAEVIAHDPLPAAREHARQAGLRVADHVEEALERADGAIIATAWPEYRALDWPSLTNRMAAPILLDGRGVLDGIALPDRVRVLRVGRHPQR